jgi:protein-tyrosine phosphatase
MKVLFVCTGNICRSPTAEGVMALKAKQAGFEVEIDSAGTHAYHVGEGADPRSVAHAKKRGYDLGNIISRKFDFADYYEFDLIFAIDKSHLSHLRDACPHNAKAEVHLYLDYAGMGENDVPDPYYGGAKGFDHVLDLIEQATDNIIKKLGTGNL